MPNMAFGKFVSLARQEATLLPVLPLSPAEAGAESEPAGPKAEYIYEPSVEGLLAELLPRFINVQIYRGLLDTSASEHGVLRDTVIGPDVRVHSFCHLEGAVVGPACQVGPYARLRPGAVLEHEARVGNFVEMKKSVLGAGSKASHLTYLGDAVVGADTNIGAGTITCNYDGKNKHKTTIGDKAFIGSNSSLVAPVTIGAGALIGAGSVITKDVPEGGLGIGRGRQVTKQRR